MSSPASPAAAPALVAVRDYQGDNETNFLALLTLPEVIAVLPANIGGLLAAMDEDRGPEAYAANCKKLAIMLDADDSPLFEKPADAPVLASVQAPVDAPKRPTG